MTDHPLSRLPSSPMRDSLLLALCALGFGLVPLFARPLMAAGLTPEAIALYRFAPGLLIALPFVPVLWRCPRRRRTALLLAGCGMAMGLSWALFLRGLDLVPVAWAGTVYMSYPLFVVLLAWLWLKRVPTARAWAAVGLVVAAAALLALTAGEGMGADAAGALLLCLPAPIAFAAIIVVLVRRSAALRPLERLGAGFVGTMVGLIPLVAADPGRALIPQDPELWGLILGMIVLTALVPHLVYTTVAPRLSEARVATLGSLELPMMVAIGWLAFGEALGPVELLAVALVLAAVIVVPGEAPTGLQVTRLPAQAMLRPASPLGRSHR